MKMPIDLRHPGVRDSLEAMAEAARTCLGPEEQTLWRQRMDACNSLSEAADVTTEMIGRPMSESERRIAEEVRQSLILYGDQL
jgi:hypothetical protein